MTTDNQRLLQKLKVALKPLTNDEDRSRSLYHWVDKTLKVFFGGELYKEETSSSTSSKRVYKRTWVGGSKVYIWHIRIRDELISAAKDSDLHTSEDQLLKSTSRTWHPVLEKQWAECGCQYTAFSEKIAMVQKGLAPSKQHFLANSSTMELFFRSIESQISTWTTNGEPALQIDPDLLHLLAWERSSFWISNIVVARHLFDTQDDASHDPPEEAKTNCDIRAVHCIFEVFKACRTDMDRPFAGVFAEQVQFFQFPKGTEHSQALNDALGCRAPRVTTAPTLATQMRAAMHFLFGGQLVPEWEAVYSPQTDSQLILAARQSQPQISHKLLPPRTEVHVAQLMVKHSNTTSENRPGSTASRSDTTARRLFSGQCDSDSSENSDSGPVPEGTLKPSPRETVDSDQSEDSHPALGNAQTPPRKAAREASQVSTDAAFVSCPRTPDFPVTPPRRGASPDYAHTPEGDEQEGSDGLDPARSPPEYVARDPFSPLNRSPHRPPHPPPSKTTPRRQPRPKSARGASTPSTKVPSPPKRRQKRHEN